MIFPDLIPVCTILFRNLITSTNSNFDFKWCPREDLLARVADKLSKSIEPVIQTRKFLQYLESKLRTVSKFFTFQKTRCHLIKDPEKLQAFTPNKIHALTPAELNILVFPLEELYS